MYEPAHARALPHRCHGVFFVLAAHMLAETLCASRFTSWRRRGTQSSAAAASRARFPCSPPFSPPTVPIRPQMFSLDVCVVKARRGRTLFLTAHANEDVRPVRGRCCVAP